MRKIKKFITYSLIDHEDRLATKHYQSKLNYNTMYENLSEKRKQELDTLREWAVCAGDDYYFSMDQSDFEKSMKDCENEEFFKAYSR